MRKIIEENNMPKSLIHGHTHILNSNIKNGVKIINPESVSYQKK